MLDLKSFLTEFTSSPSGLKYISFQEAVVQLGWGRTAPDPITVNDSWTLVDETVNVVQARLLVAL
jgi:hypothetical protein